MKKWLPLQPGPFFSGFAPSDIVDFGYILEQNSFYFDKEKAKSTINEISKIHNLKKGILMKSLRVAFFGCLSGPDLIQSWELFSESKCDKSRIERCLIMK